VLAHPGSVTPRIVLDHATASYAIGTWKNLLVWVVQGHTGVAQLEKLRIRFLELARARGDEKHVALIVLYPSESTMSAEERRCLARMIDESKRRRLASSTAVLAKGLMGAVHRSILTGMSILVPPPHPNRIVSSIEDAIAFVHPHVVQSCGAIATGDMRAMVADLYDHVRRGRA
jgi:hypothetical protein